MTTHRSTPTASRGSPPISPCRTCTTYSNTPNPSTTRPRSAIRPRSATATTGSLKFPDGLVVLGDAVCTLNPIYGQGMTVAALEAAALRRHLSRGRSLRPRGYMRDVGRISGVAWAMALGADLSFPEVEGRRTAANRMLSRYVGKLQAGAAHDPRLGRAFLRATSLVDPPLALLRPSVLLRTITAHDPAPPSHAPGGATCCCEVPGPAVPTAPSTRARPPRARLTPRCDCRPRLMPRMRRP